ncbi:MAG TPA: ATP-binding protein [Candidatus Limnocylindrales bacterium]|nr:ATP-binding protein [Candidatus Limnocylindrales bacterium]
MDMQRKIAEYESQIEILTSELAATNAGVVALYAELEDQAAQLKEVSDLKSRFLSYMSHEFRTPLGSIRSITRILLDCMDGPLNDEQVKQVGLIRSSAEELTEMVNDLLDLAKVEAGRVTISPEWFELVDLFSALRGMFRPLLQDTNVALIFEEPHGVPRVFSDDRKLSQILRNFISNALKFTTRGSVRVSARMLSEDTVEFSVADTGAGISPEHLGTLFQDFVQIETPMQRRYRGTGLGLSLSKRLAELLGGRVAVRSEVGKGSTFSVIIPTHYRFNGSAR